MPIFKREEGTRVIGDGESVTIKVFPGEVELTAFELSAHDISQYKKIKGGKTARTLKNGKTTKGKPHKKNEYPFRSISSVKKSLKELADTIKSNFSGSENEFYLTLTYKVPPKKPQRMYMDSSVLLRKLEKSLGCSIVSVCKAEMGYHHGWHVHLLLIIDVDELTAELLETTVKSLWTYGKEVKALPITDVRGLTKYLTEICRPNESYINYKKSLRPNEYIDRKWTKYLKYEMSQYYPTGSRVYTASKGMKKPERFRLTGKESKQMFVESELVQSESVAIVDDGTGEILNRYIKEVYKRPTLDLK